LLPFLFPFPSYVFLLYAIERWVTSLTNDDDPKVDFFFSQREKKEPISSKRLAGAASTVEVVWVVNSKYIVRYSIKTDLNDSLSPTPPHTLDKLDAISHICFVCLIPGMVAGRKESNLPIRLCASVEDASPSSFQHFDLFISINERQSSQASW
jgi:hypothetical protein